MGARSGDDVLYSVRDLEVQFKLRRPSLFAPHPVLHAVDGVSFDIPRGRTLGLVGESGCGKSTTGLALLGLVEATAGTLLFDGIDVRGASEQARFALRSRMQVIFQDPYSSLNPRWTAGEIVAEPLVIQGVGDAAERRRRASELFEMVGLRRTQAALYPHQFSGGQRQRICIARALALNPEFVVCDEPVSALDVAIQAQILNLLTRLQDELGLTYLFISHDLAVIDHLCDEIAVMYLGVVVERAPRGKLFAEPRHPYTRVLLSAVLGNRPGAGKGRIHLTGDLPSPVDRPPGCRFHTRCRHAKAICREAEPPLVEKAPGHWEACHFETGAEGEERVQARR